MSMETKKFARRMVREKVLQILYAHEMGAENLDLMKKELFHEIEKPEDLAFGDLLVHRVLYYEQEFDEEIKSRVSNWELERIAAIDRILLKIGMCELKYFTDIPPKVTINEAIEVAKAFSTGSSGKFINGILDSYLSDLRANGVLNKEGRGLIEETLPK